MSKINGPVTAQPRPKPQFAHDFVHARQQRTFHQLFDMLGLKPEHQARVFTTFEDTRTWIGWRGHKDQWYKHPLADGVAGLDDDEITTLKMKVMMSTC